jgi:glycosyltransferase involved in cell wall biosynthesis
LFQASGPAEADDVRREFTGRAIEIARDLAAESGLGWEQPTVPMGAYPGIVIARNLASVSRRSIGLRAIKVKGQLDVVWMSRIVRKKNLDGALAYLSGLRGEVRFTVYGPVEDTQYWSECRRLMSDLPNNVRAEYAGVLKQEAVVAALEKHHVFLFPTHGENYGYAICDALTAGCPVIISDQTPWRGLGGAGVGWDIPLADQKRFVGSLQQCVDMSADAFAAFSDRARMYAAAHVRDPAPVEQHRRLIRVALALRVDPDCLKDSEAA